MIYDFPEGDPKSACSGVTARTYLSMLRENLPAIMEECSVFQQDNAPVHTAKKV